MKPARVIEVDCFQFLDALKRAATEGHRIEKTDKSRWDEYVKANKVHEASCLSIARSRSESVKSAIIAEGDWQGFYVYSVDDQFCLKYVPAQE